MERILRKSGALLVEENEEGKILFSDVEERNTAHAGRYAEYPFAAEFAYEKDGEEIHGDTDCFRLTSVGTRGKTLIKEYSSQDGAVKVTVKQIFRQGVLSQICTIKNLGAVKLCVKKLANRFAGIGGACLSDDYLGRIRIGVVRGEWGGEGQLHWESPETLGLFRATGHKTGCSGDVSSVASYTTRKFSPVVFFRDETAGTVWAVQHLPDGPYNLEISLTDAERIEGSMYKITCGAGDSEKQGFRLYLRKGAEYRCAESLFTCAKDFSSVSGTLTNYRRKYLKKHKTVPLMFNDYMNCLFGDPTTEKELPLIDAAAECGCEYYVIDAGWYAPGEWWDSVGEWQESRERFPNGIKEVTDYIRQKGMIPGVWLELEVMGINCEKAKNAPDDWFFIRHGKRVYDRSRYQLDFRNPEVIEHVNEVIDRVVKDYGVGYIKMDYNIEPGIGTELGAESVGQGLLEHEKAYLNWLDDVFARYPDLVIENCSSGGLRIDYALLSRYSIQSTSDQEDYRNYATIAANAVAGVTPEQAAVWSYPMRQGDKEEVIYNMINAMLLRIHQSGHLAQLPPERLALVKEGIACYKTIRQDIKYAIPYWPIDIADNEDMWVCGGLQLENKAYLAVWKRQMEGKNNDRYMKAGINCTDDSLSIPLDSIPFIRDDMQVSCIYPKKEPVDFEFKGNVLTVHFKKPVMARLFELRKGIV